jgi:hypothetical protein
LYTIKTYSKRAFKPSKNASKNFHIYPENFSFLPQKPKFSHIFPFFRFKIKQLYNKTYTKLLASLSSFQPHITRYHLQIMSTQTNQKFTPRRIFLPLQLPTSNLTHHHPQRHCCFLFRFGCYKSFSFAIFCSFNAPLQSSLSALISRKTSRKVPAAPRSFSSKSGRGSDYVGGAVSADFRTHSYHNHPPHQSGTSSAQPQQYLSSSLGAASAYAPQSATSASTSHLAGPSSASTSQLAGDSASSSGTFGGSTSHLGQPQVGSLSGPAGTPIDKRDTSGSSLAAASLPSTSFPSSSTTASSSTTTYLQLPSD